MLATSSPDRRAAARLQLIELLAARLVREALAAPICQKTIMSDDKGKIVLDRKLISLNEPYEVRDWCKTLGCTEAELRAGVNAVGHSAEKVREWLKSRGR